MKNLKKLMAIGSVIAVIGLVGCKANNESYYNENGLRLKNNISDLDRYNDSYDDYKYSREYNNDLSNQNKIYSNELNTGVYDTNRNNKNRSVTTNRTVTNTVHRTNRLVNKNYLGGKLEDEQTAERNRRNSGIGHKGIY